MKKCLSILALTILIIPSVTLAAWWNPFTWSADPSKPVNVNSEQNIQLQKKVEELEKQVQNYQSVASASSSAVVTANTKLDVKLEPVKPTVITKTIQIQDPSLQNQINLLLSENNSLKSKLADLQSAYLICTSSLSNTVSAQKNQTSSENDAKALALKQIKIKIAELQAIRTEVVNFGSNLGHGMTPDQNEMRAIEDELKSFQTFDGSNMFPTDFWTKLSRYTQEWKRALMAEIDIEVARMNVEVQKAN